MVSCNQFEQGESILSSTCNFHRIKELLQSIQYPTVVPEQDTVFIERAMVSQNFINLTVKLNTGELSEQLKTYGISSKLWH